MTKTAIRNAAAWAGVAVLKKLQAILLRDGYDLDRVKPLVASLRWYTGPHYAGLPSPCPDVTEVIGVPVLTIFPNVRRMLDSTADLPLAGDAIAQPGARGGPWTCSAAARSFARRTGCRGSPPAAPSAL